MVIKVRIVTKSCFEIKKTHDIFPPQMLLWSMAQNNVFRTAICHTQDLSLTKISLLGYQDNHFRINITILLNATIAELHTDLWKFLVSYKF